MQQIHEQLCLQSAYGQPVLVLMQVLYGEKRNEQLRINGTDTLVTSNHFGDNHCNLSYDIKKLKKLLDRVEGD